MPENDVQVLLDSFMTGAYLPTHHSIDHSSTVPCDCIPLYLVFLT